MARWELRGPINGFYAIAKEDNDAPEAMWPQREAEQIVALLNNEPILTTNGSGDPVLKSHPSAGLVLAGDDPKIALLAQAVAVLHYEISSHNNGRKGWVLREGRTRVRELGSKIYELGSHPGMQLAFYLIQAHWAHGGYGRNVVDPDAFHPRELEAAWDRIGAWRD